MKQIALQPDTSQPKQRRFLSSFGRRVGKRLGVAQKVVLKNVLPDLSISIAEGEEVIPRHLFPFAPQEVWMEIGFGGGEFLANQARLHPDVGFIGCEPYINGVANLLKLLEGQRPDNVRLWAEDARHLLQHCTAESLHTVFILFPDPWPKLRHHKRRIVSTAMLEMLYAKLVPGGRLILATDHQDYAAWMLDHIARHGGFSWESDATDDRLLPPEGWTVTRYEAKTRAMGHEPVFFKLKKQ